MVSQQGIVLAGTARGRGACRMRSGRTSGSEASDGEPHRNRTGSASAYPRKVVAEIHSGEHWRPFRSPNANVPANLRVCGVITIHQPASGAGVISPHRRHSNYRFVGRGSNISPSFGRTDRGPDGFVRRDSGRQIWTCRRPRRGHVFWAVLMPPQPAIKRTVALVDGRNLPQSQHPPQCARAGRVVRCRFSEGRDPGFSIPIPPELFPHLSAS